MKKLKLFVLAALIPVFTAGCGGGTDSGGVFTNNITGTWTGNAAVAGIAINIVMNLVQPVSGSLKNATQSVNGTYNAGGADFPINGTKDGNAVALNVAGGGLVLAFALNLTSANAMSGSVTLTDGAAVEIGTASFTR